MSNQIGGQDKLIIVRLLSMVPNFTDYNSRSILHELVNRGDIDLVNELILKMENNYQLDTFINLKDEEGNTPLHIAVSNGFDKIASLLISKGADPNIEDSNGNLVVFEPDEPVEINQVQELPIVKNDSPVLSDEINQVISNLLPVTEPVPQPLTTFVKLNLTPENKMEYERIRDQSPEEVDLDMLKRGFQKGGGKPKPKKSSFGKRFI